MDAAQAQLTQAHQRVRGLMVENAQLHAKVQKLERMLFEHGIDVEEEEPVQFSLQEMDENSFTFEDGTRVSARKPPRSDILTTAGAAVRATSVLGRTSPDYGAVANRGRDLFAGVTPASCDMDSIGVAPASVPASAAAARCAAPRSLAGGLPPPRFDDALSSVSDRTGPRATSPAAALSFSSPSLPASTPSAALLGLTPASVGFALRRGPDAPSFTASPVQSSAALPLVTAAAASFVTHTPALPDGAVSAMPAGARAWVTHADSSIALDDATPMRTPAMALAFDSAGPAPMSTVRFSAAPASAAPHTAAWTHAVAPAAPPSAAMAAAATDESAAALTSQRERGAGRPPEPPGRLRARRPRRRLLPDSAPPEDTTAPPMTMGDAADGSLSGIDASGSSDTVEAGAEPAAPVLPRDGRERHAESKAGGEDGVRGEGKSAEELQAESEALAWQLMAQENMTMYERMQSALGMLGDAEAMSRLEAEDGDLALALRLQQEEGQRLQAAGDEGEGAEEEEGHVDVDGMTYEELLELGEQIGDVRTERWRNRAGRVIQSLRTRVFSATRADDAAAESEGTDEKCLVCQCEYEEGEVLRDLPCSHAYHAECIDHWLRDRKDCPLCKRSVSTPDKPALSSTAVAGTPATAAAAPAQ